MADTEADGEVAVMGTIMDAILTAATITPVDIPTGMTTYGLDIVVKFGAINFLGEVTRQLLTFERLAFIVQDSNFIEFFLL